MPETMTLILETSTPAASLALALPGGRLEERRFTSDRSHNALLFHPLAELLAGVEVSSIRRVLVGSGPGSYSGTRVGIAAAQGVAVAAGCPAVAVPSLLAVPSAEGGICLAIGDARRGSFWTARVEGLRMVSGPELTDAEGLAAAVRAAVDEGAAVVSFEEAERYPLGGNLKKEVRVEFPAAERLWRAWQEADGETRAAWEGAPPQPIYLKPPHITAAKRPWLMPS